MLEGMPSHTGMPYQPSVLVHEHLAWQVASCLSLNIASALGCLGLLSRAGPQDKE